jgi:exonuclease III
MTKRLFEIRADMKIVSWNCAGAFRKKFHLLDAFSADVLVIQECENPSKAGSPYQNWAQNYLWVGSKHKGLGIFAKPNIRLKALDWIDEGLQSFLPCEINEQFNLIATWTKKGDHANYTYIGQLWRYLQIHKAAIATTPSIICGDLNSNSIWDNQHRGSSHTDVVEELADIDLFSIYHLQSQEKHGSEMQPTFYFQRNRKNSYHIDYAFISSSLCTATNSIDIGLADDWLQHSDHMPLVFSIATP